MDDNCYVTATLPASPGCEKVPAIAFISHMEAHIILVYLSGPHNQPLGKAIAQMTRDGLVEPPALLPVAVPDYLRFGMIRAIRLFIAMARFPAYDRITAMPMPVMIVIGSEDPVRPPWKNISRAKLLSTESS